MSNVTPIGCPTRHWKQNVQLSVRVMAEADADRRFARVIDRKLTEHGRRLPLVLGRGRHYQTIAWRDESSASGWACLITTGCSPSLRLLTTVHFGRTR